MEKCGVIFWLCVPRFVLLESIGCVFINAILTHSFQQTQYPLLNLLSLNWWNVLLFFSKKNVMSESIVKYLFWDCYVLFWPSHHQPILTPSSSKNWLEICPHQPLHFFFNVRKYSFSRQVGHTDSEIVLCFPFPNKSRVWYLWHSWLRGLLFSKWLCWEENACVL